MKTMTLAKIGDELITEYWQNYYQTMVTFNEMEEIFFLHIIKAKRDGLFLNCQHPGTDKAKLKAVIIRNTIIVW